MTNDYWKSLVEKYFEAETTPEEEERLRGFLAGTEDPAFDEAKAVMGYFSVRKGQRAVHRTTYGLWRIAAAAAALILVTVLGWRLTDRNACMMVAYGEKTTDKTIVMSDVHDILTDLFGEDQGPDVAGQLTDLFN